VITFKAVRGSRIRLTMTSRHPDEARGALRISRLETPAA
jgi:beta-galactosidase